MRLLRLCLLIFALRRFLSDPMIVVRLLFFKIHLLHYFFKDNTIDICSLYVGIQYPFVNIFPMGLLDDVADHVMGNFNH